MEKLKGGAVGEYPKKIILCAHGFMGEGKSSLLLTFPPPLHIWNCGDRDMKFLLDKLPEGTDIYYEWTPFDVDKLDKASSQRTLDKGEALLKLALQQGGSLLVDAHDLLWDVTQSAKIKSEGTALRYKEANEWGFSFWGRAVTHPTLQIGMTSMANEIWEGPSSTGRFTHGGWKHINRYIETDVRMFIKEQMVAGVKPVAPTSPTVTHCGWFEASKKAEYLNRRIIENPTFAWIYKGTYGEDWPDADKLWTPS